MRNLKVLGLALVAVFAMSAMAASMASASEFTSESSPVNGSGTNEPAEPDLFTITAGNTSCKHVIYDVTTTTTPTTTVKAVPTYETLAPDGTHNCTSLGFPATIHTNGCEFVFHITAGSSKTGDVTIECPPNQEITVTAVSGGTTKCTIHVPPQTISNATTPDPVTYSTIGAGPTQEVTVKVEYAGLKYSHTKGSGLGACTAGSGTNGSYKGRGVVTATNDSGGSGHVGVFVS